MSSLPFVDFPCDGCRCLVGMVWVQLALLPADHTGSTGAQLSGFTAGVLQRASAPELPTCCPTLLNFWYFPLLKQKQKLSVVLDLKERKLEGFF